MKLAGEKTTLKLDFNNITTRELNIESLESSLNSILNGVNNIDLISNFKLEVVKQYTGENSLVLFKKSRWKNKRNKAKIWRVARRRI